MEKKLRTVIVILTILLATAIIFIGLSLNKILNDTYLTMLKGAYGNSDIVIAKDSDEDDPFYASSDVDTNDIDVKQRSDMIEAIGNSQLNGVSVKVTLTGMDVDEALQMGLIAPIKTADDFKLEKDQIIISQKTATDYGLDIGDAVDLVVNDQSYHVTVGSISESNGIYYSEIDRVLFLASPDLVNKMYGTKQKFTSSLLTVNGEKIDQTVDQLTSDNKHFTIQKPGNEISDDRDEETFAIAMTAAITIIVLISAYVILSLAKIIVSERMPFVGTFRSLGTSKWTMNGLLGAEFLVYGMIGAVLGIIAAFILLPWIADLFNEYKEYGLKTTISYSPIYAGIALTFGMLFPVCVGMIHIVSMNRKPLKEIILNTTQIKQKKSKITMLLGAVFLIIAFILYAINTMDQLLYGALSVICLIIAMVLLVPTFLSVIGKVLHGLFNNTSNGEMMLGIKNIGNNKIVANNCSMIVIVLILLMMVGMTTKGLDDYISDAIKKDFDISINHLDKEPSYYDDAKQVEGVTDYREDYIDIANFHPKGDTEQFSLLGVADFAAFAKQTSGITFMDDAISEIEKYPDGVLIDAYQAKRYAVDIGDTIQLQKIDTQGKKSNEKNLNVVVAGFIDSYGNGPGRNTALLHLHYFKEHFTGAYNQIRMKVSPGHDVEQVKKEISQLFMDTDATVTTFDDTLAGQKATIDTLISGITIIILMGMVIGILGITNNLIVSFLQRKKEYAVLYSVCMSKWQLIKMQIYELLATFIAVLITGFIGGLLMNMFLKRLLYAIELRVELGFDFGLYGMLSVVTFVILALSATVTVRKMMKMDMLKALRYE
jgi:ABC-type lipoprotein release transport system permease subunit